jgi:uncharacterized membrane protein YiaA
MQKSNFQTSDSDHQTRPVGMEETSSDWEFSGITFFRALGYVVGLLSFMVGTAIFMLGFSLGNATLVEVACFLYSFAMISFAGRIVIRRLKPKNEIQALGVALSMIASGGIIYAGLSLLVTIF